MVAPVLKELARCFNRVPLYSINPGYIRVIYRGQHALQAVPELVEQRGDLSEAQQ